MIWAIQECRLTDINDEAVKELVCIGEELGLAGKA